MAFTGFRIFVALAVVLFATDARLLAADKQPIPAGHAARVKEGLILFKQHVRPALVKHCLECHGGQATKGDFDLSTRKSLVESGMIDKTSEDSYLFSLITHAEEPHMPFKKPKLPAETIAQIARWIDLEAPYDKPLAEKRAGEPAAMQVTDADRQFWSFLPLNVTDPPAVKSEAWCRTAVDRFVLAKLEEKELHPNSVASRRTLIRRAYFDLLGLPPEPEAVEAFVNDPDPKAYEKLIDRLLDSPHYGERWARHWMDVARFAESHGYEQDYDRPHAYHYRDFLIKAFNADLPFHQFVSWQLAGDELAPEDPLAMTATGFLGAGVFPTQLTEAEFESARYDELDDMVATTGVAFLGLSIGCARCHDHKFDPIPTRDYYRLASSFTTTIRSEIDLDLLPEQNAKRRAEYDQRLTELEAAVKQYETETLPGEFRKWLADYDPRKPLDPWVVLADPIARSTGPELQRLPDGSLLAVGNPPDKDVVSVNGRTWTKHITAIRLEALTHESLPHKGPGRAANGNFALGNFEVTAWPDDGAGNPVFVKLKSARATHEQNKTSLSVAASIDDDPISGWAVDAGGIGKDQAAVFYAEKPFGFDSGTQLSVTLTFNHSNKQHAMGRIRISVTDRPEPPVAVGSSGPDGGILKALAALKENPDENSADWKPAVTWFAGTQSEWKKHVAALEAHRKAGPQLELTKVMVSSEGFPHMTHHADGRGFPHFYPETHFLTRGDVHQKGPVASQGFLQVLMRDGKDAAHWNVPAPTGWERTRFTRASLADWITDPEYGAGHLAARVIVNRLWQHHFGRGIVATPNDFGFQGERPTHPELLDWLANDLIQNGWKMKRLHKLLMTSAVYMQNGEFDEDRARIDRENLLHWRRAPRRLEAEAIRDAMLSVSGQLDKTMYGPGTLDPNMRRRSVYFFIKRSKLIPMLMLFDWPEHLVSIGRRATTTTAPQALLFMNSPQGRQYAQAFAERLGDVPADELASRSYAIAFGRPPTERERQFAAKFFGEQTEVYQRAGKSNAESLARIDYCQAVMGMNEFVYVE